MGDGPDDLAALRSRLDALGVVIDGATDDGTMHTLHVTDPDGTPLALYVEAVDVDTWRRHHGQLKVPPAPLG